MSLGPATTLCRECGRLAPPNEAEARRCAACGSPRLLRHPELARLSIAHIDCDAFYASVEKRDDPTLRDRPVIVGGGHRGVVSAACYVARTYGVRSAMPMFKALRLCPDAVVIPPNMAKYRREGLRIREMMLALTPLVEPLSIDEAFLDLTGTERLHHGPPAMSLARLARRVEAETGLTVSIGLSYNKFLAKIASDLDKPRGFAVIGRGEALEFLREKPVGMIWGVGQALQKKLGADGITRIGDLQERPEIDLVARYGSIGHRLYHFSRGEDDRRVDPDAPTKSISAETTFDIDIASPKALAAELWPLCETVSGRLKRHGLAARTVTLKLKTADFRLLSRSRSLDSPTQLAEVLYRTAEALLLREADGRKFRLIGVGGAELENAAGADQPDLLDPGAQRRAQVEQAMDAVRAKLGPDALIKGRSLSARPPPPAERGPRKG
ncbi:MAG: DNA polymerase IV 1 [Alphaproteobacteria bacterium]|nr:MAG: DNA polymerase IV 1 [Alphaproteobacteria bacterium]